MDGWTSARSPQEARCGASFASTGISSGVDVECLVEVVRRDLAKLSMFDEAGIGHQNIDLALLRRDVRLETVEFVSTSPRIAVTLRPISSTALSSSP